MQRLWAKTLFGIKGYRNYMKSGYEACAATWDDKDMNYDIM